MNAKSLLPAIAWWLLAVTAAVLLPGAWSGCHSAGFESVVTSGVPISSEVAAFVKPGVTTRTAAIAAMEAANKGRPYWQWDRVIAYHWATSSNSTNGGFLKLWDPDLDSRSERAWAVVFDATGRALGHEFFRASDKEKLQVAIARWAGSISGPSQAP
jgi:hypothetical protein